MSHRSLPISSDRVRRFPIRVRSSSRSIEKVDEALEKLKTEASRPVDVILDEEVIVADRAPVVIQVMHCRLSSPRAPSPSNLQISLLGPKRF